MSLCCFKPPDLAEVTKYFKVRLHLSDSTGTYRPGPAGPTDQDQQDLQTRTSRTYRPGPAGPTDQDLQDLQTRTSRTYRPGPAGPAGPGVPGDVQGV